MNFRRLSEAFNAAASLTSQIIILGRLRAKVWDNKCGKIRRHDESKVQEEK